MERILLFFLICFIMVVIRSPCTNTQTHKKTKPKPTKQGKQLPRQQTRQAQKMTGKNADRI